MFRVARCTAPPALTRNVRARVQAQPQTVPVVDNQIPPGCSRYTVELARPLGMVLEEDGQGNITVAEVKAGGAAEMSGEISVGDVLISTSGHTYSRESKYGEALVRSGEERVIINARGQTFDAVMAAISSHRAGFKVELTFQRC